MRHQILLGLLSAASLVAPFEQVPLRQPADETTIDRDSISDKATEDTKLHLYGGLQENECTVNIAETAPSVYEGFTRRGIYFWAYGTVIEDYCIFWEDHFRIGERFPFFQPSCYFDEERGMHRVDTKWFNDENSEKEFAQAKDRSLEWWMGYAGCRTGQNEFCWGKCI